MGFPDSPYLWRENAGPAQQQYVAVAKQIAEFEPVYMLTNPEVCLCCASTGYLLCGCAALLVVAFMKYRPWYTG